MADFVPTPRSTPTTTTGERGPENVTSTRLIADVSDEINFYQESASPLVVFTSRGKKKRITHQYRFDFLEMDEYPRTVTLSAASLVGDTTLDLVAGQGGRTPRYGVLINQRTGESVWVSSISTDQLTVTRAVGSTEADMAAGDVLAFTGSIHEDGGSKGDLKMVVEAAKYNYTEIVRTAYGVTGRGENTDLYGGKDLPTLRKQASIEHMKSLEFRALFGTRHSMTGPGGHLVTFSGGLDWAIQSNIWNVEGTVVTEEAFIEFLEEAMKWGKGGSQNGAGSKVLFASGRWVSLINQWAKDRIRVKPTDKTLGIRVMTYLSPHGELDIVRNPILDYYHNDRAYLTDMNHVRSVRHQGRDTQILKNIQANDVDGTEEEVRTDAGFQVDLEASHATLKGLGLS